MTIELSKCIPLWAWVTQPHAPGYQVFGGSLAVFCADSDLRLLSLDSIHAGLFVCDPRTWGACACRMPFPAESKETFIHHRKGGYLQTK